MRFDDAMTNVLAGDKMTRAAWGDVAKFIHLETRGVNNQRRIRYETPSPRLSIREDWNYYPTQDDMLADDWELIP